MKIGPAWILLIHICTSVTVPAIRVDSDGHRLGDDKNRQNRDIDKQNVDNVRQPNEDGEIIAVRITSSVAIERGKGRPYRNEAMKDNKPKIINNAKLHATVSPSSVQASEKVVVTEIPPDLAGANIEFIKQLHAKKEIRNFHYVEQMRPFELNTKHENNNTDDDNNRGTESTKTHPEIPFREDYVANIPLARSIPYVSKGLANYDQGLTKPSSERRNNSRLTTVSFNIVHDTPKPTHYNEPNEAYSVPNSPQFQAKVYSEPAKVYSEPAKVYSEPAKVYSEPAKIYSEPAKIYSEPAKIYSEPAKFYSQPASLHLPNNNPHHWDMPSPTPTTITPRHPEDSAVEQNHQKAENNYEVDEKVSLLTNGKSHGVQESTTENSKVGYVVEGKQYRKYRVEERTPDGFIVGEYGVVRNEDGDLRGVRYTADGEASPSLIYNALMKFLQLK